jgi:hypothetical protein
MHWQIGKGGGFTTRSRRRRDGAAGDRVSGGPPALILVAISVRCRNVPELMLASLIAGERLRVTAPPAGHPHGLVANAEFALMGEVAPRERRPEGPFGDHYGYYSLRHEYPVFHVRQMARRQDAMFPATVVGKPRQEDFFIGASVGAPVAALPARDARRQGLWSHGETATTRLRARSCAIATRARGDGVGVPDPRRGQLSLTSSIATDQPVDLKDFRKTLEQLLADAADRSLVFSNPSGYARLPGPRYRDRKACGSASASARELPRVQVVDCAAIRYWRSRLRGGCLVVGGLSMASPTLPTACPHPASRDGCSGVDGTNPSGPRAVRSIFPLTTFTRFSRSATSTPPPTRVGTSRQLRRLLSSTRG